MRNNTQYFYTQDSQTLEKIYNLRYHIYCLKKNFLPKENYPNQQETDHFDPYALHFVALDKNKAIATVRLIKKSALGLPMNEHCTNIVIPKEHRPQSEQSIAEISRLCVKKMPHHSRSETTFKLYRAMYHESKKQNITHWATAMEPSLLRLLSRMHLVFHQIGPPVDYYGSVTPYIANLAELEQTIYEKDRRIFWWFMQGLPKEFIPVFAQKHAWWHLLKSHTFTAILALIKRT